MRLEINGSKTIKMVQKEFGNRFPYLKIEFFSKPHGDHEGSKKKFMTDASKTLNECRSIPHNGRMELMPSMTASELEEEFQNTYGLSVQLFRRSGKVWLETINTDNWTLAQHNEQGRLSTLEEIQEN
jgi:hypothetical protein